MNNRPSSRFQITPRGASQRPPGLSWVVIAVAWLLSLLLVGWLAARYASPDAGGLRERLRQNLADYLSEEARSLSTQKFYEGDLSLYRSFLHPAGWQRGNVRNFIEKTLKKHPAVAPIIRRTPEFFTSNHAPFFAFLKNSK